MPTGDQTPGDGLGAIEEYRGFAVDGVHVRTNPSRKDLFVRSELQEGVGDAANLTDVDVHSLGASDLDTSNRIINPWYGNAGDGDDLHSGTSFQRGVHVINGGYDSRYYGLATYIGTPNQQTGPVKIFVNTIRSCSPGDFDQTTENEADVSKVKIQETLGHEVGHTVNIAGYVYIGTRLTVMEEGGYLPCPPTPPYPDPLVQSLERNTA